MAAMASFDGRLVPSRWLIPPCASYEARIFSTISFLGIPNRVRGQGLGVKEEKVARRVIKTPLTPDPGPRTLTRVKVLSVRLSSIGDVIQGIPALVALKETFPGWAISWLVEEASAPLLENHPCLTRLFVLKRRSGGVSNFLRTLAEIRAEQFDAAIDLQGLLK